MNVWQLFNDWWQKPFNPNGDAIDWLLFLGLVVAGFVLWQRIIAKIEERV